MDNTLLSSKDFQSEKLINKKSFKLRHKIETPYTFQIISKEKTKLYVSHENNDGKLNTGFFWRPKNQRPQRRCHRLC